MKRPVRRFVMALSMSAIAATFAIPEAGAKTTEQITHAGSYLAGRIAQKRRDLPSAAKYFGHALKFDPEAVTLLRRAFLYNLMIGDMTGATSLAERYLAAESKAPIANLALAVRDTQNGDWVKLQKRMAALEPTGLNLFTQPTLLAWSLAAQEKWDEAVNALKELKDSGGTQGLHDLHAALILNLKGDNDTAEKYLLSLGEDGQEVSLRTARLIGNFYERIDAPEKARAAYDLYLRDYPRSKFLQNDLARLQSGDKPKPIIANATDGIAEALFSISSSLNQQHGGETALILGRLALAVKSDFPIMGFSMGNILESLERYEGAIAHYTQVPTSSPLYRSAQMRIAQNMNALEKADEAESILRNMADADTQDAEPVLALARLLRLHEKWDDAIVAYDQGFERLAPEQRDDWGLLYSRGIALERAKRWKRAEADFKRALELEPDQPLVLNYLGYSWVDQGVHLEDALNMIRTAVDKRPNDGYIIDSLGWAYYKLGQYENAVPELERAVELRPEDPIINDHLGDAYWHVGRKLEASFQWSHSLDLDPEDDLRVQLEDKLANGLEAANGG